MGMLRPAQNRSGRASTSSGLRFTSDPDIHDDDFHSSNRWIFYLSFARLGPFEPSSVYMDLIPPYGFISFVHLPCFLFVSAELVISLNLAVEC